MAEIVGTCVYVRGTPDENVKGLGVQKFVNHGNGVYTIYFNFPVDDACVEIASIGEWQDPGVITAYGDPPLGSNAVSVWTGRRETGAYDMTFQLLVVKIAATL